MGMPPEVDGSAEAVRLRWFGQKVDVAAWYAYIV